MRINIKIKYKIKNKIGQKNWFGSANKKNMGWYRLLFFRWPIQVLIFFYLGRFFEGYLTISSFKPYPPQIIHPTSSPCLTPLYPIPPSVLIPLSISLFLSLSLSVSLSNSMLPLYLPSTTSSSSRLASSPGNYSRRKRTTARETSQKKLP